MAFSQCWLKASDAYHGVGNLLQYFNTESLANGGGFIYAYALGGVTIFGYDALNRLDREYLLGLGSGVYRYLDHDYDRYGNRSALALYRYEAGTGWTERYRYTYTYGKLGTLGQAGLIGGVFGFSHDGSGLRTALIRPVGMVTAYGYDGVGRLSRIRVTGTAGTLAQYDYAYDAVGNVAALTTLAGIHDYSYDGLNRLVQALHPAASGLAQEDFAYDLVGNREDPTDETLYDYDANDRILKSHGTTYAFDDDGNLVMRQAGALAELFRYDEEWSYPASVDSSTFGV